VLRVPGRSQRCPFGKLLEHYCPLPASLRRGAAAAAGPADAAAAAPAAAAAEPGSTPRPLRDAGRAGAGCACASGEGRMGPASSLDLGSDAADGPRPRRRRRLNPSQEALGPPGCWSQQSRPAAHAPGRGGQGRRLSLPLSQSASQGGAPAPDKLSQARSRGAALALTQLPGLAEPPRCALPSGVAGLDGCVGPLTQDSSVRSPRASAGAGCGRGGPGLDPTHNPGSQEGTETLGSMPSRCTAAPCCAGASQAQPGGGPAPGAAEPRADQAALIRACVPQQRVADFLWAVIRKIVPAARPQALQGRGSVRAVQPCLDPADRRLAGLPG